MEIGSEEVLKMSQNDGSNRFQALVVETAADENENAEQGKTKWVNSTQQPANVLVLQTLDQAHIQADNGVVSLMQAELPCGERLDLNSSKDEADKSKGSVLVSSYHLSRDARMENSLNIGNALSCSIKNTEDHDYV